MEKYEVKIFSTAKQDLLEIIDYLVFYTISGQTVQIQRILYGRRNYQNIL